MFRYDEIAGFGSQRRVDRTSRTLEQLLMLWRRLDCREELVSAAYLWQTGSKAYLHVHYENAGLPCRLQHFRSTLDKLFWRLHEDRHNTGLAIHGKNGCVRDVKGHVIFPSRYLTPAPASNPSPMHVHNFPEG